MDRLKSSFLATVSHELRTPLTSIIGYSEMLSEGLVGPLNQEQTDYVRTIMDKGDTLLKLISSILDISQIEAGKVRLTFEPVLVSDVGHLGALQRQAAGAEEGPDGRRSSCRRGRWRSRADREKLRQVVVNLLSNAVKFTPKGGWVQVLVDRGAAPAGAGRRGLPHRGRRTRAWASRPTSWTRSSRASTRWTTARARASSAARAWAWPS